MIVLFALLSATLNPASVSWPAEPVVPELDFTTIEINQPIATEPEWIAMYQDRLAERYETGLTSAEIVQNCVLILNTPDEDARALYAGGLGQGTSIVERLFAELGETPTEADLFRSVDVALDTNKAICEERFSPSS